MRPIKTKSIIRILEKQSIPHYQVDLGNMWIARLENAELIWIDNNGKAEEIKFNHYFLPQEKLSGYKGSQFIKSMQHLKSLLYIYGAYEPEYRKRFTWNGLD